MAQRLKTDWILFFAILAMVFFGLLMMYSASSVMAELKFKSTYHFAFRQLAWILVSLSLMMLLKKTHYRRLAESQVAFTGIGLVLVLLLAVYFIDSQHHRWLRLGGLGFQPSELAKPALIVFLAFFVSMRQRAINDRHTLLPAAITVGLVTFGVVVADLGTAVVLAATATVVFFVAGLEWRYCFVALAVALLGVVFFVVSKPYRLARIVGFVDPEYNIISKFDPRGKVKEHVQRSLVSRDTKYQAQQSKIAVGAGGPAGLGLMQSKQKLFYLPEAHTDFVYAVVCEELGLLGSLGVLAGFIVILCRGIRTTVLAQDDFGRYLALGITTALAVQAFMNMSVVLDLMPTKGIPLPMISSGGSSMLSTLMSLGLLLNVSEHAG